MIRLSCSVLVALGLAACSKGPAEFGQLVISWEISNGSAVIPCGDPLVGAATVKLSLEGPSIGELTRQAACAEETLATPTVPLDDYTLTVELIDGAGVSVAIEAIEVALSEPEELRELPVEIRVREGRFDVSWSVNLDGDTSCPDGSITEIEILALGGAEPVFTRFDCERFGGLSGLLPFGDYTVTVRLLDRAGGTIASSAVVAESLAFQSRVVPLAFELLPPP